MIGWRRPKRKRAKREPLPDGGVARLRLLIGKNQDIGAITRKDIAVNQKFFAGYGLQDEKGEAPLYASEWDYACLIVARANSTLPEPR